MLRKMKTRFVVMITAVCVLLISLFVFGINSTNYVLVCNRADELLGILESAGGRFPEWEEITFDGADPWISAETPYETRYFTVEFPPGGGAVSANLERIEAVDHGEAVNLAVAALGKRGNRGYVRGGGTSVRGAYRYSVSADRSAVCFVDVTKERTSSLSLLKTSVSLAVGLISAVFLFSLFLADKMAQPLVLATERQKRFIADAGHEMKTPLAIISANNEITEILTGQTESTAAIGKQVKRMTEMVNRLSLLARMDKTETASDPALLCLSDILAEEIEAFRPTIETENRKITADVEDGAYIFADPYVLRELLAILLDNQRKYAKTRVEISLSVSLMRQVKIVFRNDADGVPEGDLSRCFDRFYRSDEVRGSDVEGSGIGLSLAKEIVKRIDGQITAVGTPEGDFEIRISLPAKTKNG